MSFPPIKTVDVDLSRRSAKPREKPVPPVRPFQERWRDTALFAGAWGSLAGACAWTSQHGSAFGGALMGGGGAAAIAATFIGVRQLMLQDRWDEDREAVSGLAAGSIASAPMCTGTCTPKAYIPDMLRVAELARPRFASSQ